MISMRDVEDLARAAVAGKTPEGAPRALPVNVDGIPDELRALPQWVGWRYKQVDGEWTKVPVNPQTGHHAKSDTPSTWGTLDQALTALERYHLDGIGIMLHDDGDLVGVDLDKCRDAGTGAVEA